MAGQARVLRLLAAGRPLADILAALCHELEAVLPGSACSILLLDHEHRTLHPIATPSLPAAYSAAIDGLTIGPNVGSCGTAAYLGRTVIVEDIETDPLWADWRHVAREHRLRACWSIPIIAREDNSVLGTFAVYYQEPRGPATNDLALAEMCVDLAGVAIALTGAQVALAESEDRFRAAFEQAAIGMAIVHPDGTVLRVNRRSCQILGYPEEDLLRTTLLGITHPDDLPANEDLMRRALDGDFDTFTMEKRYLRQDGDVVWTLLTVSLLRHPDGTPRYFLSQIQDITERRAAEAELRASEARYRALVEHLPAVVYRRAADEQQTPLYVSPAYQALTGFHPDEALARSHAAGRTWLSSVHPEDRARIAPEDAPSLAQGTALRQEYRYARKDGSYVWVQDVYAPIRDEEGSIVAWQGVLIDISDRVRAADAQRRLAAIVEAAEDGILSVDRNETIISWNRGAERIYGYTAAEAVGQSATMLRPPELAEQIASQVSLVWEGQAVEPQETVRLTKSGRLIPVSLSLFPLRDNNGHVIAASSITRDLTALREAQSALLVRNHALNATQNGVIITDPSLPDNPIIDINPAFTRLTGYRREEAIGRNCRFLQGADTHPDEVQVLREAIAAGKDCAVTLLNYRKDGTAFWNDLSIAAIYDEQRSLTHFVGVVADATERMRLEQALRQALAAAEESAQAKSRFLAVMSHELRTPLQSVLGYADFLLSPVAPPLTTLQREDIAAILDGAQRMVRLIEQLLDLARLEAGRLDLLVEQVDVAAMREHIHTDLSPQIAAKGISFTVDIPNTLPPVAGDSDRVRQILLNIASNAVKFTDNGGVRVSVRPARKALAIAIADTGIGIAPEQMIQIFDEFQQGDRHLARKYGGSGLGLAIARQLTNQMGGHISVTSKPGHGSTFTVWLPLYADGSEGEKESPVATDTPLAIDQ